VSEWGVLGRSACVFFRSRCAFFDGFSAVPLIGVDAVTFLSPMLAHIAFALVVLASRLAIAAAAST
jgi:hypothetical protein